MATQGLTDRGNYANIANAIRSMNGRYDETYKPSEMANAIMSIEPITGSYNELSVTFDQEQLDLLVRYFYHPSSPAKTDFTYENGTLIVEDIIYFTVNGISFTTTHDMTWGIWCNSGENTYDDQVPGYKIFCDSEGNVRVGQGTTTEDGALVKNTAGNNQSFHTTIVDGASYTSES